MKTKNYFLSLAVVVLLLFGASVKAQLIIYEPFDYTVATVAPVAGAGINGGNGLPATNVGGNPTGTSTGVRSAWTGSTVVAGLVYSNVGGTLTTSANALQHTTSGQEYSPNFYRNMTTDPFIAYRTATNSGFGWVSGTTELYVSFLINVSTLDDAAFPRMSINGLGNRIYVGQTAGNWVATDGFGSSNKTLGAAAVNQTELIVVRLNFTNATTCTTAFWFNPTLGTALGTPVQTRDYTVTAANNVLSTISIRGGTNFTVDEIRVGATPADVLPASVSYPSIPSTATSLVTSSLTSSSFTLSWTASATPDVTYEVYKNGALLGTTAAGVTSYDVTGLTPGSYSMNVIAVDPITGAKSLYSTKANDVIIPVTTSVNASTLALNGGSMLQISAGGELVVNAATTVKSITVNAGGKLTLNSGIALSAANLYLKSTATDGTATFKDLGGTLTLTNPATVEQYLTTGRNWYISSPVSTATSNVFAATALNPLYYYVETVPNDWTSKIENTSTALTVGKGYVANINSDRVVTFTGGTLNTGVQSISGLTSGGSSYTGYNLVGNPYPSYLKWDNATKTNVSTSIWYRSKSTGAWLWQTYNVAGAGQGVNGGTNLIPPMQAFWVKVAAGQTGSIGFVNNDRDHLDQSNATNRLKAPSEAEDTRKVLRLVVSNGVNADEALIYADANALNTYDMYDSNKMFGNSAAVPEIFTVLGTEELAINGFNTLADNQQLALGFKTTAANTFSIRASEVKNFATDTKVILIDNVLSTEADLTAGTAYSFSSDVVNDATRFNLIFRTSGVATGVDADLNASNVIVFKDANGKINIQHDGLTANQGLITVYNALGQRLISTATTANRTMISQSFDAGVYFVTLNVAGRNTTNKVIIN